MVIRYSAMPINTARMIQSSPLTFGLIPELNVVALVNGVITNVS